MRALHVHHDPNSRAGHVGAALAARGIEEVWHQVCEAPGSPAGSPEFPDPTDFDLIVLYGSRWSTYDAEVAHWVLPELELVRAAAAAQVPVLGLCFGGQVLAAAHGATVAPTPSPEIGWYAVEPAAGSTIEPGPWLQWHFDAFEVPDGGVELARSPAGAQAFRLGTHLGLQFHPEADRTVIEEWLTEDLDQLVAAGVDAEALLAGADRHAVDGRDRAERLVARWLADAGLA